MRTLYHLWLSPPCRLVRLMLAEKNVKAELKAEKTWERRPEFLKLSPSGEVPVLVEDEGFALSGIHAIAEYLEEVYPKPPLLGTNAKQRAEVRRLTEWFMRKFQVEAATPILHEKIMKRYTRRGTPDTDILRAAQTNLKHHLAYITHLASKQNYLAGEACTLADLAAAAGISALDYLDEISWADEPELAKWYAKIKSRKSFRGILKDHIVGMPPPDHYTSLDF